MNQKYKFPKTFLWGASTSAHQVEGGNHNQWSVWELENARSLASQAQYKLRDLPVWHEIKHDATRPSNYVSGKASDHYRRYEEDFAILSQLHMNAYRFSIEWSRIEPEEGRWDMAEIEHYRRYLLSLKRRGIEPLVTFFHWTIPVWFDKKGGFEHRSNIDYFVRFAEKIADELGQNFRLVCTLNEPENYAYMGWVDGRWPPSKRRKRLMGIWVYYNLAVAHNRVAKMLHAKSRRYKVGASKSFGYYHADDDDIRSRVMTRLSYLFVDEVFLNLVRRRMDWIGVQYYMSQGYTDGELERIETPMSDLGWQMRPDDLEQVLVRLAKRYKKPLIVTETGVADRNDRYRRWWIAHNLSAVYNAMQKGATVLGYLHWSLLDNFEWAYGKWPRFGLVEVDFTTQTRTIRPSALWFGKVIKSMRQ